jgi:hypothetical protein
MRKSYTSIFDIQVAAERQQDILDKIYLSSDMTQEEYDQKVEEINQWELNQYHYLKVAA